ncbi:transcriptional regulator, XRE family [Thermoanaerobacter mathranii subsp. mathranii str. A3]|uniref:Transcriptional regulator, XRE family n=1 Tax=Thermoanaerobacter mathranii subsp. mathranii (strain DSM 11426 / CCUG 53645 / CIP 108742 / A3) TaxID=583358 RepID=A0ABN3Z3K2_THEM3|nr:MULTISPECIES: helix-turn-helix domain-containing protein [Thermoanaerobacter]ADH60711.1 transcriptional regulator, XRE family [Thermoanaerobacter mathranii subsp. mathranii str. A3]
MDGFYYDLEAFGEELKNIRKSLGLSQSDVSKYGFINRDTLRKIENGKVIPKHETLELLSHLYKKDLNELLLKYRLNDYSIFFDIKSSLEKKLESGDFESLRDDIDRLKKLLKKSDMSLYYSKLLNQLLLIADSVFEKTINENYEKAMEKLQKAMEFTIPNFSLSNYTDFVYSDMEIRILMNMALIIKKTEGVQKSLEMLLFCLENLSPEEWETKIKIYYNISYNYHILSLTEESLHYANLGIETCVKNNTLSSLGLLYFRKAIAEYHLGREEYKDSLSKSIHLLEITGQEKLIKTIMESCRKFYNLEISKETNMLVIKSRE